MKLTKEARRELIAEYRKGVKCDHLAAIFDISPDYVRTIARRAGVTRDLVRTNQLRRMVAMQNEVFT
jgi:hypothetical protein